MKKAHFAIAAFVAIVGVVVFTPRTVGWIAGEIVAGYNETIRARAADAYRRDNNL